MPTSFELSVQGHKVEILVSQESEDSLTIYLPAVSGKHGKNRHSKSQVTISLVPQPEDFLLEVETEIRDMEIYSNPQYSVNTKEN
jgi:hypothetical protein